MNQRQIGLTMAAVTGTAWAVLAIALRQALRFASPGTIVWFRMVVAFFVLFVGYAIANPRRLKLLIAPGWPIFTAGLALALNYFSYLDGLAFTSASNAQILIQLGPILLLISGIIYFKESPTRQQGLGIAIAISGLALFFWDQILLSVQHPGRYIHGNLWLATAAGAWAFFAVTQKRVVGDISPQQFNLVIYGICMIALSPLSKNAEIPNWSWQVWVLMIALGLNTVIAYGALAEALKRAPSSHVSVILASNPLLTISLVSIMSTMHISWAIPEPIKWRGIIGALFVVSGVILTVWQKPAPMVRS